MYIYNKYKEEIGHIYMNFLVYKNRKTQCIRKLGLTCRLCTIQSLREPFICCLVCVCPFTALYKLYLPTLTSSDFTVLYQLLLVFRVPYCTHSK